MAVRLRKAYSSIDFYQVALTSKIMFRTRRVSRRKFFFKISLAVIISYQSLSMIRVHISSFADLRIQKLNIDVFAIKPATG